MNTDLYIELQRIIQRAIKSGELTDYVVGTGVSVSPLEIQTDVSMLPLKAPVLLLTSAVVSKVLKQQPHTHESSETVEQSSVSLVCYENGVALYATDTDIIINRGLVVGDKVLLLKVAKGQQYIVLSRIF